MNPRRRDLRAVAAAALFLAACGCGEATAPAGRLAVWPADTTIYVGSSYTLCAAVVDANGNARSDAVTLSASRSGISLSSAGDILASQMRYQVTANTVGRSATAFVSVVPHGRVVTWTNHALYLIDTDGSHVKPLLHFAAGGSRNGVTPQWTPDGSAIFYTTLVGTTLVGTTLVGTTLVGTTLVGTTLMGGPQAIDIVDTLGNARPLFPNGIANVTEQAEAMPSADGQWVFFSAMDSTCGVSVFCLYRAHIDGSAPERLGTAATASGSGVRPAPSPDGSRVAFVTSYYSSPILIMDVASRTVTTTQATGDSPQWSPDGMRIAYIGNTCPAASPTCHVDNAIFVMNADGSNSRQLTASAFHAGPLGWTRDGNFVIAYAAPRFELVDVRDGSTIPLVNVSGSWAALRVTQ
jgi:dipeptidyl aminopeptidase/acylaminoacyl peptidase